MGLAFRQIADAAALELVAQGEAASKLWPGLLRCWEEFARWLRIMLDQSGLIGDVIVAERRYTFIQE